MSRLVFNTFVAAMIWGTAIAAPPQKVVYAMPAEAPTLDPTLNYWFRGSIVLHHLFTGLYRLDQNGKAVPGMASGYSLDKAKTVYTFNIAKDARWSDGKPVVAADFEYAWKRALLPKTAAPGAFYLYYIKNAKAANEGKVPVDEVGVKVLDPKTLQVTLEFPTPYFLDLLAVSVYAPGRRDVVEGNEQWSRNVKSYVCNGPFMLTELKPKEKYVLKKNPNYLYASKVRLETLEIPIVEDSNAQLAAYQTGEIQVFEDPSPEARKKYMGSPDLKAFPRIGMFYMDLNTSHKPLNDPRVRQALSLGINREQITRFVLQTNDKPAFGFVPYGIPDGVKTSKEYRDVAGNLFKEDLAKARQLLAEAGFPGGQNFPRLNFICMAAQLDKDVAQALQGMWKANLGVNVEIRTFESKVYWGELYQGNFDVARNGFTGDYADPMGNLEIFLSPQNVKTNRWSNAEFDQLIKVNHELTNQKLRMANFIKAEQVLATDMPCIPIYYYTSRLLVKPNVKNAIRTYLGHPVFDFAYVE